MHGLLDPDGPQAPTGGVAWIVMALPHHAATPPSSSLAQVIQKMVKQRQDSIESYKAGGREDLVAKEQEELDVYTSYLPAM